MTGIGVEWLIVIKILNHLERSIRAVYDRHSYDNEKRAALLRWDRHLNEIVEDKPPSNMVVLAAIP
jgi:hypothetical protein